MADQTLKPYEDKDFVDVVDADGEPLKDAEGNPHPSVPKSWIGTDLLPAGTKKASKSKSGSSDSGSSSSSSSSSSSDPSKADGEPAGNASAADWEAFARTQGATEEDLLGSDGEPLGRDALREKYASKS